MAMAVWPGYILSYRFSLWAKEREECETISIDIFLSCVFFYCWKWEISRNTNLKRSALFSFKMNQSLLVHSDCAPTLRQGQIWAFFILYSFLEKDLIFWFFTTGDKLTLVISFRIRWGDWRVSGGALIRVCVGLGSSVFCSSVSSSAFNGDLVMGLLSH